jgi:hypothetical protein
MYSKTLDQWFPTSGRDPNQDQGRSDVGSREACTEKSIIMKILCDVSNVQQFTSFYLQANYLSNQHMCELFK